MFPKQTAKRQLENMTQTSLPRKEVVEDPRHDKEKAGSELGLASEQDSGGFRGAVLCSWRTECARNIRSQRVVNQVTFEKKCS